MDTGKGRFRPVEQDEVPSIPEKDTKYLFRVGETVQVKGSWFRVKSIKPKQLILKLLPRNSDDPVEIDRRMAE